MEDTLVDMRRHLNNHNNNNIMGEGQLRVIHPRDKPKDMHPQPMDLHPTLPHLPHPTGPQNLNVSNCSLNP
jgi:hypothetical protein